MRPKVVIVSLVLLAFSAAACGDDDGDDSGLPNPASVFCEEQGGTVETRSGSGGEYGVCVFDDGSECDEWAFYRGECVPGE
jgi:putative hemolysin